MRDLYNRKQLLQYWVDRVDGLNEPDKTDMLRLIEHMQDKERATLWITRCISALLLIRTKIQKPFREATKEDIRAFLKWMEQKGYKASTNEKFRQILKLFYKTVYGGTEFYPDQVKWFSVRLSQEKTGKGTSMDLSEFMQEEDVIKLVNCAPTIQKKAFLACMYECGARPEEFLRLTNRDLVFDTNGAVLILRGKTGERRVRIVAFSKLLQQWLEVHPLREQSCYAIWISEATNYKNRPLGLRGAEKIIETSLPRSGISNKHARLYILRHSRATHLAKYLTSISVIDSLLSVYLKLSYSALSLK